MRLEIELTREEAALVMAAIERGEFEKFGKLTAKWRERAQNHARGGDGAAETGFIDEQIAQRRPARRAGGLKSRKWWKTEQGSLT